MSEPLNSTRSRIARAVSRWLTSPRRRHGARSLQALRRRLAGRPPTIHYFHQFDDPYSQLAAGQLPILGERYHVRIETHAVPPPDASAAPAGAALTRWAARDAARWARHYGLPEPQPAHAPPDLQTSAAAIAAGQRLRRRLGHYLGAMFFFEGEWYWGLDRLHHLETRLLAAGLGVEGVAPAFLPPPLRFAAPPGGAAATLDFFCSLRSPYTWLAVGRAQALAKHYGAALRLKFVLPMVMRGLPVPLAKRLYILADAKREAEVLGLPFGDVVDPVGEPVERGLAVLSFAIREGLGAQFLESFLRGVFAEGIDAGSRRGLATLAARAGLPGGAVAAALADDSWRSAAAAHREELLAGGLWGVPAFRVNALPALWGQDRLWMVEQDLLMRTGGPHP